MKPITTKEFFDQEKGKLPQTSLSYLAFLHEERVILEILLRYGEIVAKAQRDKCGSAYSEARANNIKQAITGAWKPGDDDGNLHRLSEVIKTTPLVIETPKKNETT